MDIWVVLAYLMHGLAIWFSTGTAFGYHPLKRIGVSKQKRANVMNLITTMGSRRKRPGHGDDDADEGV